MEHIEYVYTEGIDEEEISRLLKERGHGVLGIGPGRRCLRGAGELPV